MFPPLKIPVILWWGSYHKASIPYGNAGVKATSFLNGVYSNRLDQAGLDSPPFDDVKPL